MTHGKHPRSAGTSVPVPAPGSRSFQILRHRQPPAEPTRTIKGVVPCAGILIFSILTFSATKTVDPFADGGGPVSAFTDLSSPALSPTLPPARTATPIMPRLPPRYRSIDEPGTDRM